MKVTAEQLTLRALYELLRGREDTEWLCDMIIERLTETDRERETDVAPEAVTGALGLGRWDVYRWARWAMPRLIELASESAGMETGLDAAHALRSAVAALFNRVDGRADGSVRADAAADARAAVEVLVRTMIYARIALRV